MKKILALMAVVWLAGCASNEKYIPPEDRIIDNSRAFNESFDSVWKRLVKNLSKDFFVINNIDKSSGIINVSFSSNNPSDYVDCGITEREFSVMGSPQNISYNSAESSSYKMNQGMNIFTVTRETKLSGRANVHVATEKKMTEVSVNAKYVFDVKAKAYDGYNRYVGGKDYSHDFSTKQKYKGGVDEATCVSRGVIEKSILDMAGK